MIPIAKVVIGEHEKKAVLDVLDSGCLSNGEQTEKFEEEFSKENGADHGVAVCNGTVALSLALRALDVRGCVAVPAFSFIATATSVVHAGCRPLFIDVTPDTFTIDPTKFNKQILDFNAIIPVALYGQSYDADAVNKYRKEGVKIVQDLAQAHGAEFGEKKLGKFGDASCYSFYATKNITTGGEGGMVTTNSEKLYKSLKMLVNQGQSEKYVHPVIGYNYRMTEMQAAIGRVQLRELNIINRTRMRNADRLKAACDETAHIKPPFVDGRCKHVFHMFTCLTDLNRDRVVKEFQQMNIDARPVYPMPINDQEAFRTYRGSACPVARGICGSGFHLPVHQYLSTNELSYLCNTIRRIGKA
jgi:perosamine synthetase